jgi:hypothetical protein
VNERGYEKLHPDVKKFNKGTDLLKNLSQGATSRIQE